MKQQQTISGKILESLNKRNRKLLQESNSDYAEYLADELGLEPSKKYDGYSIPADRIEELIEPGKILAKLKKAVEKGHDLTVEDSFYDKAGGVPLNSKGKILLNQGTLYLDEYVVEFPEPLREHIIEIGGSPSFTSSRTYVPYGDTYASWDDVDLDNRPAKICDKYELFEFEDMWTECNCVSALGISSSGLTGKKTSIECANEFEPGDEYSGGWSLKFDLNTVKKREEIYMWEGY